MASTKHGSYKRDNYGIITPPLPDDASIGIPALREFIEDDLREGWNEVLKDAKEHCGKHNITIFEVDSVLVLDANDELGKGKYLGAFIYDDSMVMSYPTPEAVRLRDAIHG